MREKSHLDDMRTAIRGDFERLEERRGQQELMRVPEREPESDPQSELASVPQSESEPGPALEEPSPAEPARRSWVGRLLGR